MRSLLFVLELLLRLLEADLGGDDGVLRVGERLGLIEVGLDAREHGAAAHDVAVAMEDLDDFAGDGRLHLDLHFRLDGADFGDLDLDVARSRPCRS